MASKTVLVTGAVGFISMQVCGRQLARGEKVAGVDSLTPYCDPALNLPDFIAALESNIGEPAILELCPMLPGGVLETCADSSAPQRDVGLAPSTPLAAGRGRSVDWHRLSQRLNKMWAAAL